MAKMVNYGVIGCGMMGQEHLRNISLLDDARVAAIFEPDADMAGRSAQLAPDAVICSSLSDLLARPELDCLLVASPNYLHVTQFEEIARTRPLPLLMEKPLFTDPDHRHRIAELQSKYQAPVWVAMEYRYMPPIAAFLEQADAVTGGITMLTIREHRFPFLPKVGDWNRFNRNTGGTLVEKCCHFFDLMRLLMGSDPVSVMASAGQDVNHLQEKYDGKTPDIWDAGFVIFNFSGGRRAMLELCMYADGSTYQEELTALGPDGKIEAKVPGPGRFWQGDAQSPPEPKLIISPRNPFGPREQVIPVDPKILAVGDHNGSTFYQHQRFLDVVRGTSTPEVSVSDGAQAVMMGFAAQKSATTGAAVDFRSFVD
ncbi:MAG: Gfo/Idh/MocA family oxidoreductase [Pseudomonadota bacterium]